MGLSLVFFYVLENSVPVGAGRTKKLNFEKFDINSVLKNGIHLTGSEGSEYDLQEEAGVCDVSKQKQLLNAKIGLDVTHRIGIDVGDLISAEDFIPGPSDVKKTENSGVSINIIFCTFLIKFQNNYSDGNNGRLNFSFLILVVQFNRMRKLLIFNSFPCVDRKNFIFSLL